MILADDAASRNGFAGLERNRADHQALCGAGHAGGFDRGLGVELRFADHVRNGQEGRARGNNQVNSGTRGS